MLLLGRTDTSIQPFFAVRGSLVNTGSLPLSECPVEVEGGAYEGQVRERLREISQGLAVGSDLLRVQPQVVRITQHLLEDEPGFFEPARAGERLDKPERAQV